MRPCLNRATLGQGSFEEFLDAASAAGFPAVEGGIEPLVEIADKSGIEAAAEILKKRNLVMAAFGASATWQKDDAEFEKTFPNLQKHAEVAAKLGIVRSLTWIPPAAGVSFKERWDEITPRLRRMYDALRGAGIRFGVEFIGPKTLRKKGNDFIHTMKQGRDLADALGPDAGLLVDAFHWYTSGATIDDLEAMPVGNVIHVHVNDAPDRPRDEQIDGERLLPGEGVIDLKGFLGALKRMHYTGAVSVETFSAELRTLPMAAAAAKAKAALDKVLSAV